MCWLAWPSRMSLGGRSARPLPVLLLLVIVLRESCSLEDASLSLNSDRREPTQPSRPRPALVCACEFVVLAYQADSVQAQYLTDWANAVLLLHLPRFVPRREYVRALVWLAWSWLLGSRVGAAGPAPLASAVALAFMVEGLGISAIPALATKAGDGVAAIVVDVLDITRADDLGKGKVKNLS